jgi:hypothetical protein
LLRSEKLFNDWNKLHSKIITIKPLFKQRLGRIVYKIPAIFFLKMCLLIEIADFYLRQSHSCFALSLSTTNPIVLSFLWGECGIFPGNRNTFKKE